MKIALCQINPTVGNFNAIRESITQYYKKAIDQGAGLVVFPEMVTTGYPPQDLLWENGFINKNSKLVESIAKDSSVPIIFGFVRSHLTIIRKDRLLVLYCRHLAEAS